MKPAPLTLALPKGRLDEQVQEFFHRYGINFSFKDRKLVAEDERGLFRIFLIRNVDLPTYLHHGIAGLGISGDDTLYEAGYDFIKLRQFPFGSSRMCLATTEAMARTLEQQKDWGQVLGSGTMKIVSKYTRFTRDWCHQNGLPVDVIKLNGSVELAAVLGLSPFIVDIVETGSTLKANKLEVIQTLAELKVHLVANPAYYKIHYQRIQDVLNILATEKEA